MQQYNFYATLLDKFESYINSSRLFNEYWGFSENPALSEEEFEKEQFQTLINTINRVPFDSELADKGTAFNEVIDCMIEFRKSDKMEIKKVEFESKVISITANYKNRLFDFEPNLCREFAKYCNGALTQQYCEGYLGTKYGRVKLYGYIDGLMPFKIYDIKTTRKYNVFKYRHNWQHKVYPFCLQQHGTDIFDFEYIITDFKNTYSEMYNFREEHIGELINHCERLIEFIEMHKSLITDEKIFNYEPTTQRHQQM